MTITDVGQWDFGVYTCVGSNNQGSSELNIELTAKSKWKKINHLVCVVLPEYVLKRDLNQWRILRGAPMVRFYMLVVYRVNWGRNVYSEYALIFGMRSIKNGIIYRFFNKWYNI